MKPIHILLAIALILNPLVSAHQPRIVFGNQTSPENPVKIEDPEISKAYYGILNGTPDFYKIKADQPFTLYLNILAPDLNGSRTDFLVEVSSLSKSVLVLNGTDHRWTKFYEEFAGNNYLKGPEVYYNLSAGQYYIKVYNKDNKGKYSLAVGNIESFPPSEVVNALATLPIIQNKIFEKPFYSAYLSRFTMFLLVPLILLLLGIALLFLIVFRRQRKKRLQM